jgi:Leucine-rich repeat (LRR) protein
MNSLSGLIPEEIKGCEMLQNFAASNYMFEGEIPSSISYLQSLRRILNLANNSLSGPIPISLLSYLSNLTYLNLLGNNNTFVGSLPREIGNISTLESLFLFSNFLTGEIPKEIGKLKRLNTIYRYDNQMSGFIPR